MRTLNRVTSIGIFLLLVAGCASTGKPAKVSPYANLPLTEAVLLQPKWQAMQRPEPKYPIEDAKAGNNSGCATVEYVITPDYQIKDLRLVTATSRYFGKEALSQVKRWNWQQLPAGLLTAPVRTSTRFEYCMSTATLPAINCFETKMRENTRCSGEDVKTSIGFVIRRPGPAKLLNPPI